MTEATCVFGGSGCEAVEGAAEVTELALRAFVSLCESLTSSVSEPKSISIESTCESLFEKNSRGCSGAVAVCGERAGDESEMERCDAVSTSLVLSLRWAGLSLSAVMSCGVDMAGEHRAAVRENDDSRDR